ncbi:MAG: hypothetical protein V2I34_11240 [Bacteroidales bacterium]|jgi:hypothetical protein|nr:hypothetical protein [Bacteroidales bacterium]
MKNKLLLKTLYLSIAVFTFALLFNSCKSGGTEEEKKVPVEITEIDEDLLESVDRAKKIFYSLPSPLESAMLIKSAGASFNEELLNATENTTRYTTNKMMALNLGIYTCDLSFASLYDQTQLVIEYMSAAQEMADGLGILDAINEQTIQRLEENINNRDVILDIVSETFLNSSSYLEDNEQHAIASIVLVGGWMEGLYIATQIVDMKEFDRDKLVGRIIDQKLSIGIMLQLLKENDDHPSVPEIITQMEELKTIFDKINIKTTDITPEIDEKTNITVLKSSVETDMTPGVFEELAGKVAEIRSSYVK